jgi:RAP domain
VQRRERLQPSQVPPVWNQLGKAVQQSLKTREERQRFWIDHQAILQMLIDQTIQSADALNGRGTATVTHSVVKLLHLTNSKNLGAAEIQMLWNILVARTKLLLVQSPNSFNAREMSNLLWAYGKGDGIVKVDGQLLDSLAKTALLCINDFAPQGLATVAWGLATLKHRAPLLFDAIAKAAQVRINEFNPQDLSNVTWAYATLNDEASSLFDAIARAAPVCIGHFKPQELSNLSWAFATMNHEAPVLFNVIASAAQVRIGDFKPQELSNTAWAFATLKLQAPLLFEAIAQAALVRIGDFNPQNLAITAWAFATLNHEAPSLFEAIAKVVPAHIGDFNPQNLAITAWAFATLNHEAPSLFEAIAKVVPAHIGDFNPQNLANTAWAYATLNHDAPSLFHAIANAALVRIDEFNSQTLSNTAWSFATLQYEAPSLFDAIARAAIVCIREFSPHALANTAWAFATMNHEAPSLFESISQATRVRINDFNPQNLSNTAWSFAVFNKEPNSFIPADSPFAQTLLSRDPSSFSVEEIHQLHQFQLWCQEQTGASWYPDELSRLCRLSFVSAATEPSRLQNDVVTTLGKLQDVSCVEVEVSTKSGYSLDAIVTFRGERIGVEVDGPSHFVGRSQSPKGSTILKLRQVRVLESLKLVSVPYWQWNGIDKGSSTAEKRENKERYLRNLLDEALVVSRGDSRFTQQIVVSNN